MNDKERLRRKVKLTKQTILQELESSEGKHPESIPISTSFLLDIIREYEQQQKKIERYENALKEISHFNNDEMYEGKEFVYIARQALEGDR
jgi:hypothetical protein